MKLKHTRKTVKKKSEELDRFFKVTIDLLCIANTDGDFIQLSNSWEKILGYNIQSLEGQKFLDFVHPQDLENTVQAMSELSSTQDVLGFINRYRCKDGSYRWIEWNSTSPDGKIIYASARDITERFEITATIEKERTFLRKIIDTVPGFIFVKDENSRFMLANKALAMAYGTLPENMIGKSDIDFNKNFDEVQNFIHDDKEVIKNKIPKFIVEETITHTDGTEHFLSTIKVPLIEEDGSCRSLLGVTSDITGLKFAEKLSLQSEEKFRNIIHSSPMGIHTYRIDAGDKLIFEGGNTVADKILGIDHNMLIGKTIEEAFPALRETEILNIYKLVAKEGTNWYNENVIYDDNKIKGAYEVHAFQTSLNKMAVMFLEITERKKAEQKIRISEETLRQITENMVDMIGKFDEKGNYVYISPSFEKILGYKPEDLIGKFGAVYVPPEDFEKTVKKITDMLAKGTGSVQFRFADKAGNYHWIESTGKFLFNPDGKNIGSIMGSRDITDRKMAEDALISSEKLLRNKIDEYMALNEEYVAMNEELSESFKKINDMNQELIASKDKAEESDRLKSAFLANMSHEIRTPMNAIVGFADLLNDAEIPREKTKKYINIINSNSHQLLAIINDIIDISKIEAGQVSLTTATFDLNQTLRDLHSVFKTTAALKNIELIIDNAGINEIFFIETDETKLKQILTNLLSNAVKFTQSGKIEFGYSISDRDILFFVEDTGIGISEENKTIVFERFRQVESSLSRKVGGTGLGLSISKAIVELMDGSIWLESAPNKGSKFFFTIHYKPSEAQIISTENHQEQKKLIDWF